MKKYLLTLFVISLAISACSAQGTDEPSVSLIGAWKLTSYGPPSSPEPAVEDSEAGLTFNEDGTVGGNSGCNGFGGNYIVEGDQITFSEIVSTLIACEEPLMSQEEAVLKVLTDAATYKIEGDTLTLTSNDIVLVLTRSTASTEEPSDSAALTGAWKLTSYGSADTLSSAVADVDAGLTFNEDGTLTGNAGCNGLGGGYTVEGDQITFSEIVSTKMACDEPRMSQEESALKVLTGTAAYKIEGNTLTLTNADMVLVLAR